MTCAQPMNPGGRAEDIAHVQRKSAPFPPTGQPLRTKCRCFLFPRTGGRYVWFHGPPFWLLDFHAALIFPLASFLSPRRNVGGRTVPPGAHVIPPNDVPFARPCRVRVCASKILEVLGRRNVGVRREDIMYKDLRCSSSSCQCSNQTVRSARVSRRELFAKHGRSCTSLRSTSDACFVA